MGEWVETHRDMVEPEECDFNHHMNVKSYFAQFCSAGGYLLGLAGMYYGEVIAKGFGIGTLSNLVCLRRDQARRSLFDRRRDSASRPVPST